MIQQFPKRFYKIMRITGGHAARRILKVPKGLDVRPTPDLVKQAYAEIERVRRQPR